MGCWAVFRSLRDELDDRLKSVGVLVAVLK